MDARTEGNVRYDQQPKVPRSEMRRPGQAPALHTNGLPDRVRAPQSRESERSRPIFGDDVAQILGRKLATPIGRKAVVRLARPHLIDVGISTVQTVEHVLD